MPQHEAWPDWGILSSANQPRSPNLRGYRTNDRNSTMMLKRGESCKVGQDAKRSMTKGADPMSEMTKRTQFVKQWYARQVAKFP